MAQQRVTVTILQVSRPAGDRDHLGHWSEDDHLFHLPGADHNATIKALRAAGFQVWDRLNDLPWPEGDGQA